MRTWQLAQAKARLSEVVERSLAEGPQEITRHGRRIAIVVSAEAWDCRTARRGSLVAFLDASPLRDAELEIDRPRGGIREPAM